MTVSQAESLLGLKGEWDELTLKKAFKSAALKNHPDHGGTSEDMIRVSAAYQLLKKKGPSQGKAARARRDAEWKEMKKKKLEMAKAVIDANFSTDKFSKYFTQQTGKPFTLEKDEEKFDSHGGLSRKVMWTSTDGNTVFSLELYVSDHRITTVKALGGADSDTISFTVMVQPEVLHDNRKSKMRQKNWDFSSAKSTLTDPSKTFPKSSIKKMMAGNDKKRKFKKRDMILGLEKKLNSRMEYKGKDIWAYVPIGDFQLNLWRSTMMGSASWSVHSVFEYPDPSKPYKRKSYKSKGYGGALESETLIKELIKLQSKSWNSPQALADAATQMFKKVGYNPPV